MNIDRGDCYGLRLGGSTVSILDPPHTAMNPDCPAILTYGDLVFRKPQVNHDSSDGSSL